jgi:hypothetical protein
MNLGGILKLIPPRMESIHRGGDSATIKQTIKSTNMAVFKFLGTN